MRGKFTHDDVLMTAPALGCLMLGAIAFASQTVVNRGFYAIQNTFLPAAYGSLAVVSSIPLYYLGMQWMGLAGVGRGRAGGVRFGLCPGGASLRHLEQAQRQ